MMDYILIYTGCDHIPASKVENSIPQVKGMAAPTLHRRNLLPIMSTGSGRNSLQNINHIKIGNLFEKLHLPWISRGLKRVY